MKVNEVVDSIKQDLAGKLKTLLQSQPMNISEIADALICPPALARKVLEELRARKVRVDQVAGERYLINAILERGGTVTLANKTGDMKFGFTTDNHLNNRHERLDVLNAAYDDFAEQGIAHVFNAGNMIEGEARFNKMELINFGMGPQVRYLIDKWPVRKGITTHFVTGDDHEGWYAQRELINIGEFMEAEAVKAGRKDLHYIGHVEADVRLECNGKFAAMRVCHPGGGSAYAFSYTAQKIVEAYQGGEKPAVLLCGHYHKYDYCYPREVHAIQGGCTCDQTGFMRKNKIAAHVGYVNIRVQQDSVDAHLTGVNVGWRPFYDRGFYEKRFDV